MSFLSRNVRAEEPGDRLRRRPRTAWSWQVSHLLAVSAVGITGFGLVVAAAAGHFRLSDNITRVLPRGIRDAFRATPHMDPVQMPQGITRAVRQAAPAPANGAVQPETFGVGSSEEEVRRLQGRPGRVEGSTWFYGRSEVHFIGGRVVSWTNASSSPLRVR